MLLLWQLELGTFSTWKQLSSSCHVTSKLGVRAGVVGSIRNNREQPHKVLVGGVVISTCLQENLLVNYSWSEMDILH